MNILFMGTPGYAVPSLKALLEQGHAISGVTTQPDRPSGRGRQPTPPPVKVFALEHGLPVYQPENVNERSVRDELLSLRPDLVVVAAFGQLLSRPYLEKPPCGAVNVHASLLPRHRGAAPVQAAILVGDTVTGVTVQRMVRRLDAGPILRTLSTPIGENETASELEVRLADLGAQALAEAVRDVEHGTASGTPQDEAQATYAPRLSKKDGLIDWSLPAEYLDRFVRAMTDWPGAFTFWISPRRGPVRLVLCRVEAEPYAQGECVGCAAPGEIVAAELGRVWVQTGRGILRIIHLKPEGGRVMSVEEFLRGHRLEVGQRFVMA